jgi:hypothetical protein
MSVKPFWTAFIENLLSKGIWFRGNSACQGPGAITMPNRGALLSA